MKDLKGRRGGGGAAVINVICSVCPVYKQTGRKTTVTFTFQNRTFLIFCLFTDKPNTNLFLMCVEGLTPISMATLKEPSLVAHSQTHGSL